LADGANGVRLGWLINPQQQQVEIYKLGQAVEVLQSPPSLDEKDVLPGFTLDLSSIFQQNFSKMLIECRSTFLAKMNTDALPG
jgi:Uma2 family endonuclease